MLGDLHGAREVFIDKGDRHDGYGGWALIWVVFAIIIVFLFVVFAWKKDGHRGEGLEAFAPLALGLATKGGNCDSRCERWDTDRDVLREAGDVKTKICDEIRDSEKENAKYFFDQLKSMMEGFKQVEVLGMQQTEKVLGAVSALTMTYKDDIIRKQDAELAAFKAAFMGHPVRLGGCDPAFPRG